MTHLDTVVKCRHCARHIVPREEQRKNGRGGLVDKTVWYHKWSDRRYCMWRHLQGDYPKWRRKMAEPAAPGTVA